MINTMTSTGVATFLSALLLLESGSAALAPKMNQEPVYEGKTLGPAVPEIRIESNSTIVTGECTPDAPFAFPLYGATGRGAIGVRGPAHNKGIAIALNDPRNTGDVSITGVAEPNYFAIEADLEEDFMGIPFHYYLDIEPHWDEGSEVLITCTAATDIIVIATDDYDFVVDAVVIEQSDGDEIKLGQDVEAVAPLQGSSRGKGKGKDKKDSPVDFVPSDAPGKKIKITHDSTREDSGIALVDGIFQLPNGKKVRRTFVHESKKKPSTFKNPRGIKVKCCDINDDGDIEMSFPGLAKKGEVFLVDVRLGLDVSDSVGSEAHHSDVVDVSVMLTENGIITVHGGWIRNTLKELGLTGIGDDAFEVSLVDLVVSDPNDGYRIVGVKGNVLSNGIPRSQKNKRKKLSQAPSFAEENYSIKEMKVGKDPRAATSSSLRRKLTGVHKKILLHGYCSGGNPWPEDQFTDAIVFADEGFVDDTVVPNDLNNWSHHLFAEKIDAFAEANNIHGCSIIAHSQGGAAALHMYRSWHTCLDNADQGGSKLIQSVGTPYQGTALAGNLAMLGDIFGVGCGANTDLTHSGAEAWLSTIPSWARSKVTYYTTTQEVSNCWWCNDYCHLATDAMLWGDDDGTTAKSKGQLSGAINGGNESGQCHTSEMDSPAQYLSTTRNSAMNSAAKY